MPSPRVPGARGDEAAARTTGETTGGAAEVAACGGGAAACGAAAGVQGRWRWRAIPAAPPLLCLSARDVEGRGGGRGLIGGSVIGPGLWLRPGTYDSLFPGREKARDL